MTQSRLFDVAVIGAGPGGYVAAIKIAQAGKKVALIEKNHMGGTCLNVGCIPTKTLIANAHVMHTIKHAEDYGIETGPVSFDFSKMKKRKDGVVEKIRKSLEGLIKANMITIIRGQAEFVSPKELKVKGDESCLVKADKIIIATGSEPLNIPAFPCDHKKVLNSSSILDLENLPKSIGIIGGGYIGCEFASLYAELGVKVVIFEALPSIIYTQGKTLAQQLTQVFKQKSIEILTDVMVEKVEDKGNELLVHLKGKPPVSVEKVLVSIGRKIVSDDLKLEKAGIKADNKGSIPVNLKMETSVPGIYAIGDVTGKMMLAHVASHQGLVAASNIIGHESYMHYNAVPAVIFTHPEIASVGMTEEQLQESGHDYIVGKFPFQVLGKSIAALQTDGFAQILTDKKTGQILGAQVMGHEASTLIAEMALAIANELTVECLTETIHAHPTIAEAWLEAGLIAQDQPIHFPPKIRK